MERFSGVTPQRQMALENSLLKDYDEMLEAATKAATNDDFGDLYARCVHAMEFMISRLNMLPFIKPDSTETLIIFQQIIEQKTKEERWLIRRKIAFLAQIEVLRRKTKYVGCDYVETVLRKFDEESLDDSAEPSHQTV